MRYILLSLPIVLLMACGTRSKKEGAAAELKVEIPPLPAFITAPTDKAQFMADHYWDRMNFTDTAYIDKDVTLRAFSNYADMLRYMPVEMAGKSADRMMSKARADSAMYAYFAKMSEDHFYKESPYRNEDIYIAVLHNIIAWDGADELHKLRPRSQLELALKNRVGDVAADFEFTDPDGRQMRLHGLRARYTLLYFNTPDCPHCERMTGELNAAPMVQRLLQSGELKIAVIYTENDVELWRAHLGDMPAEWTKGHAPQLDTADIYDLRALPALYLMDGDKRVLLKDAPEAKYVQYYFEENL